MIKRTADRLFKWYCNPDFYPDIKGDLEELYSTLQEQDKRFIQWYYLIDVILLFRISLIRPITQNSIIKDTGMIRNYFKISVRSLARHKMFTAINITGLAIGLASFLLLNEYVGFERSYDAFHHNPEQLYRVSYVRTLNDVDGDKDAMASRIAGKTLEEGLPEVVNHTVSKKFDFLLMKRNDVFFRETKVVSADPRFLQLFKYQVLAGDPETMLSEPLSVVLTESRAKAYFGDVDPVGKTMEIVAPYSATVKVTGLVQDVPDNTHYKFDILLSDATLAEDGDYDTWNMNNYYVFLEAANGTETDNLEQKANEYLNQYINNLEGGESLENGTRLDVHLVKDIYLTSDFTFEPGIFGSERAVNFLMIISIFLLVIAWVNYVNLSTARAVERAKEVGLRKVIGAIRKQLIVQFLCEAFIVNMIGAILAFILAQLALPFFNQLIGKEVHTSLWNDPNFIGILAAFTILGTFASGFYPAIVLSGFKPITILKGKFKNSKSGVLLRKALVIVQFAASIILISSTMIIYQQVNYMQGKDLGVSLDRVINISTPEAEGETDEEYQAAVNKLKSFRNALRNHSAIESVGASSNLPGGEVSDINSTTTVVSILGRTEPIEGTTYVQFNDEGFLEAVDMRLVHGRNFEDKRASDTAAMMVNEAFVRKMGIDDPASIINEKLKFGTREGGRLWNIIGVIGDFNRTSLRTEVEPTLYIRMSEPDNLVIELASNYMEGLAHVEATWTQFFPNAPFDYDFLDERFAALYDQDEKFGETFLVFASLAIFIAILGLFGLSAFLSIQRSKEVGVRKVLGASKAHILGIFYKDFFLLIAVAAVVGTPLVYFIMNGWLDNYAYRISFPWLLPVLALLIVSLFALATVGYQTLKVASLDPAKTLKYE